MVLIEIYIFASEIFEFFCFTSYLYIETTQLKVNPGFALHSSVKEHLRQSIQEWTK